LFQQLLMLVADIAQLNWLLLLLNAAGWLWIYLHKDLR
jgi:hypothetical protein